MGNHAREFSHATQSHFTPAPAHGWGSQGFHQIAGFLLEPLVRLGHEFQLLIQPAILPLPNLFRLLQLLLGSAGAILLAA